MLYLIPLSQGYETLVDEDMIEELLAYKWHAVVTRNNIYARRCTNYEYMYMHHQILRVDPKKLKRDDMLIDHIDRNSLNNTKENLRIASRTDNVRNSIAFKNRDYVYFHKQSGKYNVVYKGIHMGQFRTHEEASAFFKETSLANN